LTGARHWLEFDNRIVAKDLALGHDVEMIAVSVLVGPSHDRAPLCIAVVRTQVCDHYNDAHPCRFSCSARRAWRRTGGRQLVAFPTSATAPARR
jgi:hypothetical protein